MADEKLKKRIQRCLGILTTVLSKPGINRPVLAQEYGCAVRTIADDIALLKTIGFAIHYDKQKREYTLSVKDLNIPPLPLNKEQMLALFIASQLMVLTPLEQKANEAVQNMLSVLSEDAITFLRNLTDRVYIAPGGGIGDTKILFDVYRAVSECRPIRIRYQAFYTHQEEVHDVDPYGIYIEDRSQSYLVGKSYGQYQKILRFKLCRIQELTFRMGESVRFAYPSDFSIREEMAHGLWGGDQEYEVVIRFYPEAAQLVREREPKERIEALSGGCLLVRRTVRNLDEVFYKVLRRYKAKEYDVLEPPELLEILREEYEFGYKKFCRKVKTNNEITTF